MSGAQVSPRSAQLLMIESVNIIETASVPVIKLVIDLQKVRQQIENRENEI